MPYLKRIIVIGFLLLPLSFKQIVMIKLKIAGVPEHFNLPWHLGIETGKFGEKSIDLTWRDIPEGTGKLCQMLRDGETDMAVILTEGIIKDITAGNPSKIVQVYVESPLIWGIHVAADSQYHTMNDIRNGKVAISRYGSGSHLMAYVNADNQGWDTQKLDFEVINTLGGAIDALTERKADYFMWERFMTKPVVDRGIFRRIDDCPTPWPSFVIAVRNDVLKSHPDAIGTVLDIINQITSKFKEIPGIDRVLAERFHQKTEDIQEWLKLTEWSQKKLDKNTFEKVQNQLVSLNIIENKAAFETVTG